jgi:hypothetical protein
MVDTHRILLQCDPDLEECVWGVVQGETLTCSGGWGLLSRI